MKTEKSTKQHLFLQKGFFFLKLNMSETAPKVKQLSKVSQPLPHILHWAVNCQLKHFQFLEEPHIKFCIKLLSTRCPRNEQEVDVFLWGKHTAPATGFQFQEMPAWYFEFSAWSKDTISKKSCKNNKYKFSKLRLYCTRKKWKNKQEDECISQRLLLWLRIPWI